MADNPHMVEAIKICGSEAKLAVLAGVSQPAIHKAKRAERVSAELAIAIERATGQQIPRWRLRPDLWAQPAPAAEREAAA